ncbi:hypothetical protein QFZ70_001483 [Arthrobacter sp. V1I9]|uniref:hypothetical protein n=1 Tax=Arthrobacter sp. V1I9 TaxID=3042275 RepID=UPI00278D6B55|nr:hypothetical protein [Arthrobacter sp. V1I9]MDQ0869010.1 hypothetical protein [Arthrobacter sp. V1I9]
MSAPDTELFELCKEVYRRFPSWKYEIDWMVKANVGLPSEYIRRAFYEEDNDEDDFIYELEEYGSDSAVPLYTSDYLREKLRNYDFTIVNLNQETLSLTSDSLDDPDAAILGKNFAIVLLELAIALDDAGEFNHA